MSKKLITKTVIRTIMYQLLILFTGLSIGFISHATYWGKKAPLIHRSFNNIFYPIEYNDEVKKMIMNIGRLRIFFTLPDGATDFKINQDDMRSDEHYIANYEYMLNGEKIVVENYSSKINWKSWEYDYPQLKD
jgi:hypothetical protein